ncbi:MAG: chaperone modulator CbpM [Paracoccus sp. (in: a-proteobacteria)]|nr:chaperone modulator CbpM [Paracoccus sp. (in: a-proteobacteria)]
MTRYNDRELIELIEHLTESRLQTYLRLEIVRPVMGEGAARYREVDLARARLACDLEQDYALGDDGLRLVLSLLDEMHGLRGDLHSLLSAVAEQPDEVRERLSLTVARLRG